MSRVSNKEFSRLRTAYPIPEDVKEEVYDRAGHVCETCGADTVLQLHHLHYGNPFGSLFGKECPEDLKALCEKCHQDCHFGPDGRFFRDPLELAQYWENGQPSEDVVKFLNSCIEYDTDHPEFWRAFSERALYIIRTGRVKYGAAFILEGIRWTSDIKAPDDKKAAYFARKFMLVYDKIGFFDLTFSMADFWKPWVDYKLSKDWTAP